MTTGSADAAHPVTAPSDGGGVRLVLPGRTLLLVAGLPGAGKSTLLQSLDAPAGTRLLDSGAVRTRLARLLPPGTPYPAYRWLTHLLHRSAVVAACLGPADTVIVHLPATSARVRTAVRLLARACGRAPHLLWLDVPPDLALRGQRARGRVVRTRPFARHAARAEGVGSRVRDGRERGWASVRSTDRSGARRGLVLAK
ncbi:AAA family ATPase [Pseudonocardia nematodicida]|uniref:AAA family ATPase n=1 Tax=Pseudonocardia nematodicida TaxID=1206997 RepID=A0ABV1KLF9_9PSEU